MTKISIPLKRHILKYGIILGCVWIVFDYVKYLTGHRVFFGSTSLIATLELIIHIVVISWSIYNYKSINKGY